MDQTTSTDQIVFRHIRDRGKDAGLDRCIRICVGRQNEKATPY